MKSAQWLLIAAAAVALAAGVGRGEGEAAKVQVKLDTPKDSLESLDKAVKAMDVDAIGACTAPEYRKALTTMMGAMKDVQAKEASARKAVTEKFGKEATDATFKNSMSESETPLKDATENGKINWDKIVIKTEGDAATIEINGKADNNLNMKKIDGKWYIVPPEPAADMAKKAEGAKAMMSKIGEAYASFEKLVREGKVEKDKLAETLAGEMMKAMTPPAGAAPAPAQ